MAKEISGLIKLQIIVHNQHQSGYALHAIQFSFGSDTGIKR